ncbi:hypothetical protein DICPUDRAFT_79331 [Dictyostelium purpureum]|uniref:EGF-like domain-containing protein n=1 Tax=Dictyostelium purpureum TaxID=5786 RepID=F0ZM94_DICPU|nr:uncharacterized protein DICPUDRAFT_79331 [Dictyostelium purpureum]EGC34942.1 hypothetical protein DICPUDRAFT_79331 [Dictyostelium purpureum]|eukprot:XP_003288523.1 hypothetical protein DICPUDRAFT_79331 [Dictyostelium purpureum]
MIKKFYCFIFLLFFFKLSKSAIPQAEYDCYKSFVEKFGLKINYPSTNGVYPDSSFCPYSNCHSNGSISIFSGKVGNGENPTDGETVSVNDLLCFPYITQIYLEKIEPSEELIYYKFPTVVKVFYIYNNLKQFTQKLPELNSFYIETNGPITNIKMSYLNDIRSFTFYSTMRYPTLEVDSGADKKNLRTLIVNAGNLPDFRDYQFDSVRLSFSSLNPSDILTNFQYLNSTDVQFSFKSTIPFYLHLNSYIKTMYHYFGDFESTTQFYDMSNLVNYQSIKMSLVGNVTLYQNKIPFKVSPTTNLAFSMTPFNTLPISAELPPVTDVGYLKTASYTDGYLSGDLPEYNGQGSAYFYDNNKLTGTIPESWCGTVLSVAKNKLTGSIPSCFTCYFKSNTGFGDISRPENIISTQNFMFDRFAGNSFSNYDKNIPCTTYKPQVKYHNQTTIILSGIDIGHQLNHYFLFGPGDFNSMCKTVPQAVIRFGYEYYCNQPMSLQKKEFITLYNIGNNIDYTFSLVSKPPTFTSIITAENNKVNAIGTFFSSYLGQSEQTITIAGTDCQVTNTAFTGFTCITSVTLSSEKQLVVIKNDNQTKKVFAVFENNRLNNKQCPNDCEGSPSGDICDLSTGTCVGCPNDCSGHGFCNESKGKCDCNTNYIGLDCSELYIECPNDCSSHGQCNTNTGICQCNTNYIQDDCSELYIPCPNNCSSHGQCNTNTGICKCDDNYIQDDCSELFIECTDPTCSSQGHCDTSNGICNCDNGFGGDKCEFSQHYITSVNPSNENGGEASFYGSFGEQHNQLSVIIGSKTCPVTHSSNDLINCTAPPGKGIHSVNITQNNIVYIGKDIYIYSKVPQNIFECPKNCSSHGKCNTSNGKCECYLGYTSFDCGSMLGGGDKDNTTKPTGPPTSNVDNSTGIVDIQNEKINFKIYLKSLNEIDINNKIVKSYPLVSDWTVNKTQSNIYTFEQSPNKDEFKVISTIEQIENDKSVSFAGIDFLLTNNSIKFTVSIKNYKYQSFLNTLQLEMQSNTTELTNDDCNSKETQLDTENLKHQYDLSYIKLSKNNVDFVGRFVNKVVSDSKPTFLTTSYTKLNDSVTITLHLPHCVNECLIDPDFSVLLSSDFSDCKSPKQNIKWQIPVGVVVGVVGASCLGILFYKRKSIVVNGQKLKMNPANKKL